MATVPVHMAHVMYAPGSEPERFLPEGPRIVEFLGRTAIAWVNIQTAVTSDVGELHFLFQDNSEHRVIPVPGRPGFLFPTNRTNTVMLGLSKEVGLFNLVTRDWQPLARIPDESPRTIINDGEILPGGSAIVFGTKDVQFADNIAHLYLFTLADRRLSTLTGGQLCSNGKVITKDEQGLLLYDIDTPRRAVTRYRLNLGGREISDEQIVLDLRDSEGFPDGMCDCGDGTVIIAFYNPEQVAAGHADRFRLATGELVEQWLLPGSPRVTCPLLMNRNGSVQLVLTTAMEGMATELRLRCPEAGSLFQAETNLSTCPPREVICL